MSEHPYIGLRVEVPHAGVTGRVVMFDDSKMPVILDADGKHHTFHMVAVRLIDPDPWAKTEEAP